MCVCIDDCGTSHKELFVSDFNIKWKCFFLSNCWKNLLLLLSKFYHNVKILYNRFFDMYYI